MSARDMMRLYGLDHDDVLAMAFSGHVRLEGGRLRIRAVDREAVLELRDAVRAADRMASPETILQGEWEAGEVVALFHVLDSEG